MLVEILLCYSELPFFLTVRRHKREIEISHHSRFVVSLMHCKLTKSISPFYTLNFKKPLYHQICRFKLIGQEYLLKLRFSYQNNNESCKFHFLLRSNVFLNFVDLAIVFIDVRKEKTAVDV